jgi:CheY-like chemotaxis protein
VESEVGRGTTFHFTIRVRAASMPGRVYLHTSPEQLHDKRVLIVDDNATNLRILTTQTQAWGMIPTNIDSPLEALNWVQAGGEVDIALLDMQMPDMDGVTLAEEIRKLKRTASLPMVMLTSLGRKEPRAASVNFAAYLYKPIRLSQLHNVLMEVFAQQPVMSVHKVDARSARLDATLADRLPLRILLAEDHPVNQRLAVQILSKMGYRADVAATGVEVLQAVERQPYDVILMDVQMPEMDGLEATHILCERYPKEEQRPTIIAMTAEAMSGDREKCLAAGMDDYISKPIHIPDLVAALSKSRVRNGPEGPASPRREAAPPAEAVAPRVLDDLPSVDWQVIEDLHALQDSGAPDFVKEMKELFIQETSPLIKAIHEAIDAGNADGLRRAAHTLKGNSNSMGARRLGGLCFELEKIGKSGAVTGVDIYLTELEPEFARVRAAFSGDRQ